MYQSILKPWSNPESISTNDMTVCPLQYRAFGMVDIAGWIN